MTNLPQSYAKSDSSQLQISLENIQSNLITVIGYELWNPLSTIQVCLESLANEPEMGSESRRVFLEIAFKDIKYLHQLIENCLTFSKIDEGRQLIPSDLSDTPKFLQQVLNNSIRTILPATAIENTANPITELFSHTLKPGSILSDAQEEILEHIRHNIIAIVGHEIRTPLCGIEMCLEILSDSSTISTEYRQEILDIALQDLARLQKLIKDFFILERLEKGQVYHRPKYILVRDAIDLALASLRDRHQSMPKVVIEIPSNLPLIKVDEDILVETLIKILDNAYKFSKSGGEIKIQAQLIASKQDTQLTKSDSNLMLEIAIADKGRGITPHHLEAIFNCFYQEENSLRRTVNGTGIGLTICRYLITSLGGKIWARSAGKDCGSSIHFTLPLGNCILG